MSTNSAIQPAIMNVAGGYAAEPGIAAKSGLAVKPWNVQIMLIRIPAVRELSAEVKQEFAERTARLNELARKYPFNILHKVKKHDPL